MKKTITYLILWILFFTRVNAQDIHFSQFNEHPALINPALTGAVSPIRASAGYKDQWRSVTTSYKTFGASYEMRFKPGNWQQVDKFRSMNFKQRSVGRLAAGISAYNDKAGDGNMGLTQVALSLASFVPLNEKSFLSLGLQASIVQRRLDNTKLIFPNQYTGYTYDAGVASGENFSSQNFTYANFAGGLLWSYSKADKKIAGHKATRANIGVSVYNINRPTQKYLMLTKNALYLKYVFHGDFLITLPNSKLAFAPSYLFQLQGSSNELLAGLLLKYYLGTDSKYTGIVKRSCLSYGGYYRAKDAFIAAVMYEHHEQYAIGLSYDLNLSQLSNASKARGGLELLLKYTPPNAFLYQKKKESSF